MDEAIGHRHISTLEGQNGELVLRSEENDKELGPPKGDELRIHIDELEGTIAKRYDQLEEHLEVTKAKTSPQ